MGANHPEIRDVGKSLWAENLKAKTAGAVAPKDLLGLIKEGVPLESIQAAIAAGNDPMLLKPRVVDHTVEGQVVRTSPDTKTPTVIGDYREKYGPAGTVAQTPNGPIIGQTGETGKIHTLTSPIPNPLTGAFDKNVADETLKAVQASHTKIQDIPQKLATLEQAANAVRGGIKSGITGEINLGLSKAYKELTGRDIDPAIANTEEFKAQMAGSVLEVLKTLKPASDTDVKYAEKAAGGAVTLDDRTMLRLIDSARAASYNSLFDHERLIGRAYSTPGMREGSLETFHPKWTFNSDPEAFNYDNGHFTVRAPWQAKEKAVAGGNPKGAISLDEYLKKMGQ
jgi:hypothetical protein